MADSTLNAERRTEFGKGAARRIRRAGKIPAVMYGHGTEPVHITLPGHAAMLALKQANAVLTLVIDGKEQMALAKDIQRDPIKPVIDHVDLVIVKRGEKVTVDVPVTTEGEAGPETVVTVESQTLSLLVEATRIPEAIVVDIEGLEAGTQIKAEDLKLPEGAELTIEGETLVVNITAMISQEALDAELAAAEEETGSGAAAESEDEAAEGEGDEEAEGGSEEGSGDGDSGKDDSGKKGDSDSE